MTADTDFPSPLQWSIDHHPSDRAIQAVRNELIAYNIATAAIDTSRDIAVFLHDTHGQLRGGIVGTIWGQKDRNWTLAFFASLRWLIQKALQDWHIISQSRRLLASRLQQGAGMLIAMLTHHICERTQAFLGGGMVQAPL